MSRSLLLLLLVATGLRLWGVGFGLDFADVSRTVLYNQVDERGMVQAELDGLLAGNLHPGDFLHRGAAGYYLLGAVDAVVLAPLALAGDGGWSAQLRRQADNPSLLFLVHRLLSVLAGVASVALMVRVCRRELGPRAALLGGALLAVSYLHVRESHFGTVDVLWGLLTLATVDQALLLLRDPRPRRYVLVGLLAGATAATKYFGVLLVAHLVVAHLAARTAARAGARPAPGLRPLLIGLLAVPAGFVVLSPYLFFAADDLVAMVRWSAENIGAEPSAGGLLAALSHHARWTLGVGLGEPVFALSLVGLVLGWLRGGAPRLLAVFALLLLPTLFLTGHFPVRFGVALLVMLVPPAALAADALLGWLGARLAARPGVARAVLALVLALLLLPSVARSVAFNRLIGRTDTRLQMLAALAANGAPAEQVLAFGLYGLPRVPPGAPPLFVDTYRAALRGDRSWLDRLATDPPRYLLHDLCSGVPEAQGWDALEPLVAAQYREVLRLEPRPDPAAVALPDPAAGSPAHMIPYANPWAMTRPGSALVLYERRAP